MTTAYLNGGLAEIEVEYSSLVNSFNFTVSTTGKFQGQASMRAVTLRLVNAPLPLRVEFAGKTLPYDYFGGVGTWKYDGSSATLVVTGTSLAVAEEQTMHIQFSSEMAAVWGSGILSGLKGVVGHANFAKQQLDEVRKTPGSQDKSAAGELLQLSSLGERLSDAAGTDDGGAAWLDAVNGARKQLAAALAEVKHLSMWDREDVWKFHIDLDAGQVRKRHAIALLEASLAAIPSELMSLV